MNEQVIDIATKSSAASSWGGAVFGLFQGLNNNDIAMWAGIAIAFVGMVINTGLTWYYKRKAHRLAELVAGKVVDD